MAPITRRRRRLNRQVQIPNEILGNVYRYVDRPRDFGAVNSTFRGVQTDPYFERTRKKQLIADAISKNNGSRVFDEFPPGLNPILDDGLFLNESGCIIVMQVGPGRLSKMTFLYGAGIKRIEIKAIIGLKSISNFPRFVPVGRFTLSNEPADGITRTVSITPLVRMYIAHLQQNIPALKTDLMRALRADLQNPCTTVAMRHMSAQAHDSNHVFDYSEWFQQLLEVLPSLEPDDKTVMNVMAAMFDPIESMRPELRKENVKIINDTIEVSLCFPLNYHGYWY